nr:uncharacterized protein LOC117836920 isoform X1 [Setaria viridis]
MRCATGVVVRPRSGRGRGSGSDLAVGPNSVEIKLTRSPRASQLVFSRGMFPSGPGDLAAAGHAQVHAMATIAPPPLLGVSAPAANGFGRPPPFAAWPIFEGSAAAPSSNTDHSTAPLTIIYAGSVRAFDSVPMEQAEKILYLTAKEAQAAETPAFQQPEPAAALPIPSSSAAQIMTLLGLANANDSLLPKRAASLVRFLHKRKQRVESAAAMPYPCEEVLPVPAQMDPSTAVYARDKAPSGDIEQPWGTSEDGAKSMKENHGEAEEAVNTNLKL